MILSCKLKSQCTVLYMYPGKPFNFSMGFPLRFCNILFFLKIKHYCTQINLSLFHLIGKTQADHSRQIGCEQTCGEGRFLKEQWWKLAHI